ncbi:porin [Bradyrhizobium sp. LHD-71]|uniref:porin n=1 Tax=Bradyrhizobium sp. LHD-71 TaxID=3072141 RepID=UPI0035BE8AC3
MSNALTRLPAALLLVLLAPIAGAHAEPWDAKAVKKKSDAPVARPADRADGMKPCPEFGAGFYRLAGSDTCIRISGGVSTDLGVSGTRR